MHRQKKPPTRNGGGLLSCCDPKGSRHTDADNAVSRFDLVPATPSHVFVRGLHSSGVTVREADDVSAHVPHLACLTVCEGTGVGLGGGP